MIHGLTNLSASHIRSIAFSCIKSAKIIYFLVRRQELAAVKIRRSLSKVTCNHSRTSAIPISNKEESVLLQYQKAEFHFSTSLQNKPP